MAVRKKTKVFFLTPTKKIKLRITCGLEKDVPGSEILICLIPDLRFAFHLALCVRLSGRGQKKAPEVQKKMSRGSKKDPGFATRCFGAEEKTAQNDA